jgi:N-acetylglucosamine-6-phosphate deacetylase
MRRAVEMGFRLATHLYSGMSSITRVGGLRVIGAVEGSLIYDEIAVELIADGKHLPLELLALVYKIKGPQGIILATDAMRAAGTTADRSILGSLDRGRPVIIKDGVAKLPDESSLAGSIATADLLLRTMVQAGVPWADVIRMLTETPARLIGRYPELGALSPGSLADLNLMDDTLQVRRTMIDGTFLGA